MNFKKTSTVLLLATIVLGTKLPSTYGMDRGDIELFEFAKHYTPLKEERSVEEENVFVQNKLKSPQTNKQKEIQKERETLAQKNQKTVEPAVQKKKIEDPKILAKAQKLANDWAPNVLSICSHSVYRDYLLRIGTEEEKFNKKYKDYTDCWWTVTNHDLAKAANCDPNQQLIKLATTDDDLYVILLRAKEDGLKQKLQRAKAEYFVQQAKALSPDFR